MSIPTETHIELHQRGIERLMKVDHYAGRLAVLHASELYDRAFATMPGYSAKYLKSHESPMVGDFVQQLRLQQLRLKADLRSNPAMKPYVEEQPLKRNAALLETMDQLSLHLCMNAEQDTFLDAVPVNDQGQEADVQLHSEGAGVIAISPYPFRREPLLFSIMARRIAKRPYSSDLELQKTLAAAQHFPIRFTMRAGRALSQAAFH